jgi:hypothetical protein
MTGACVTGVVAILITIGASASVGAASAEQVHGMSPLRNGIAEIMSPSSIHGHDVIPVNCTFNGVASNGFLGGTLTDVSPGEVVEIACIGAFLPDSEVAAGEESPLVETAAVPSNEADGAAIQYGSTDYTGSLDGAFTIPSPFVAPDPSAVCPPTAAQAGLGDCILAITDGLDLSAINLQYGQSTPAPVPAPPPPTAVGMASTADGGGYWVAWSNGNVTIHGDAQNYGNASGLQLVSPITHIVATSDGKGYWLVAGDGGTFAYGDAQFHGSMGGQPLNQPVVDMAPTPDDGGYWLVASDGGIFAFGDAQFHGSMGGQTLNKPVVGMSGDAATGGYWLVATDGGIFAFGAPFFGSTGSLSLNRPVNGMTSTVDDNGYLFVASDGGIFAFGDAQFHGSTGSLVLNKPIVGMATGGIFAFDAPFFGAG